MMWMNIPVVPDDDEARRWAEEELSKSVYSSDGESLLIKLIRAISEFFSRAESNTQVPVDVAAIVIVSVLAVAAAVAFIVLGPVRRRRRSRTVPQAVLGDDTRSAAELREAALNCAAAGQWSLAVMNQFRAVTRSLIERAIIDDRPGQTAHEVVLIAGPKLPPCQVTLQQAGRLFDRVCYGEVSATQDEFIWIKDADASVRATRPDTAAVLT